MVYKVDLGHRYTARVTHGAKLGRLFSTCCACVFAALLLVAPMAVADDGKSVERSPFATESPPLIEAGVTIGGTLVGGLTQREAKELVTRRFQRSFELVVSPERRQRVSPMQLGARALIGRAVDQAARRRADFPVPLTVEVDNGVLRRFLKRLGKQTNRPAVDARFKLLELEPFVTKSVAGRRLREASAMRELKLSIRKHERDAFPLPYEEQRPKLTETELGRVIVIRRDSRELYLYNGPTLKRKFRVATGQSSYPTPLGEYEIITMQRYPTWYPPTTSAWAQGLQPVPPGPGNPLGTRWMGISAPYVGIHGTPDSASIGYSASHGCVRMLIPQVEWLFERVEVGTPVYIVAA